MKGKVLSEQQNNLLTIEITRSEACGKCKGCFAGQIQTEMELDARNLCDAEVGDWVELELEDNAFFKAVTISYGIPFICFVIGIFVGELLITPLFPNMEANLVGVVDFLVGMLFVVIAYAWMKTQNHKWEDSGYTPMAVRLTEPDLDSELACELES